MFACVWVGECDAREVVWRVLCIAVVGDCLLYPRSMHMSAVVINMAASVTKALFDGMNIEQ